MKKIELSNDTAYIYEGVKEIVEFITSICGEKDTKEYLDWLGNEVNRYLACIKLENIKAVFFVVNKPQEGIILDSQFAYCNWGRSLYGEEVKKLYNELFTKEPSLINGNLEKAINTLKSQSEFYILKTGKKYSLEPCKVTDVELTFYNPRFTVAANVNGKKSNLYTFKPGEIYHSDNFELYISKEKAKEYIMSEVNAEIKEKNTEIKKIKERLKYLESIDF